MQTLDNKERKAKMQLAFLGIFQIHRCSLVSMQSTGKLEMDDHDPDLTSTRGVLVNEPLKPALQ